MSNFTFYFGIIVLGIIAAKSIGTFLARKKGNKLKKKNWLLFFIIKEV